ncbi:snapalysin [Streptomyces reniochalinae]|uniref:Extracellular small neutral protease n=1 Tax=Streptomyces reniochalinae TaxID=2250578 RepID=A0A367EBD2_9ACTN|nr:snapalysin [Streptomyces reniochalinae]RCG14647.1 snapalysin [Streptomyces reniochalinae]
MRLRTSVLSAAIGLGTTVALGLGAVPATASDAGTADSHAPAAATSHTEAGSVQGYTGESDRQNQEFFKFIVKEALKKQGEKPGFQQVTVKYDASGAPSFRSQIANSAAVWNSAVQNVQLAEGSGASFDYREGDDPRGSYASTDGHGSGYIFLDYAQNQQYDSNRVVAHETGHVLGLPDHYEGPCDELMSGGGPGPSCTNDQPNATERAQVEQLWANGVAEVMFEKAAMLR